ncbi:MAG: hypothetical protein ACLPY2_26665 [Bryobacteraceae bacterium]|jgi:hypothetical protein
MNKAFLDYYRCPERYADFQALNDGADGRHLGYFRFGGHLCYGASTVAEGAAAASDSLPDVLSGVEIGGSTCFLPFNLTDVITNLRQERYVTRIGRASAFKRLTRSAYYLARPCLTVPVRRHLQRLWLKGWDSKPFPRWPVDRTVDQLFEFVMTLSLKARKTLRIPFIWFWPEGKKSCAIVTHDVETGAGLKFCDTLMDIDDSFGIKSSFQLIPGARYTVSTDTLEAIRGRGFEINVHDFKHDGRLFEELTQFQEQARQINAHTEKFDSKGFRSGSLYRNLDWYGAFRFSYDMSVPNVGHLDPQPGGCCTVMPFYIGEILELPLTTIQDYSLFNILNVYSIALWEQQIDVIRRHHGLISFNVHPDYLKTPRERGTYEALLRSLASLRSEADVWIPLPKEVDTWWRQRSQMSMVPDGGNWRIEGAGAEHATVAYASLVGNDIVYSTD